MKDTGIVTVCGAWRVGPGNLVFFHGRRLMLQAKAGRILGLLLLNGHVRYDEFGALFGNRKHKNRKSLLAVYMTHIRKVLPPGYEITADWGVGYFITDPSNELVKKTET